MKQLIIGSIIQSVRLQQGTSGLVIATSDEIITMNANIGGDIQTVTTSHNDIPGEDVQTFLVNAQIEDFMHDRQCMKLSTSHGNVTVIFSNDAQLIVKTYK